MRFMMMIKSDGCSEAGVPPSPELMAAMDRLTEEAVRAGVVLEVGGLLPSAMGSRIHVSGGRISVTDGPFAEAKELVGGFAIIRASSKQEAIEHGRRVMELHVEILGPAYEGQMEVRPMADFGPESAPAS
jgi:hypothetical protein